MHNIAEPYILLHYYYMVASFALMLRCFFMLFVIKEPITKTDFTLSVFWPVMIWLVPINFIRDTIRIINLR